MKKKKSTKKLNNTETISTTYKIMVLTKISSRRGGDERENTECVSIGSSKSSSIFGTASCVYTSKLICEEISWNEHTFVHASDKELGTDHESPFHRESFASSTKHFLGTFRRAHLTEGQKFAFGAHANVSATRTWYQSFFLGYTID